MALSETRQNEDGVVIEKRQIAQPERRNFGEC